MSGAQQLLRCCSASRTSAAAAHLLASSVITDLPCLTVSCAGRRRRPSHSVVAVAALSPSLFLFAFQFPSFFDIVSRRRP
jgi:hypothetical protein